MTRLLSSPSSKATSLFLCLALLLPLIVPAAGVAAPGTDESGVRVALGACEDDAEGGRLAGTLEHAVALALAGANGCSLVSRDEAAADYVVDARLLKTQVCTSGDRATAEVALILRDRTDGRVVKQVTVQGRSHSRPRGGAVEDSVLLGEAIAQAAESGAAQMGAAGEAEFGVIGLREKPGFCRIAAGRDDGITEGSEFAIYRRGKQIGVAKVVKVDRLDSLCEVTELAEGVSLQQGDMAGLTYRAAPQPQKRHRNGMETALGILFAGFLIYMLARNSGGHRDGAAGRAARITLTANPTTAAANGTDTVTISATVTTPEGTSVPDGTEVRFRITSGPGVVQPSATTTNGVASVTLTASTTAGTAIVEAAVGDVTNTVNVTFTATGQTSRRVTITAGNASILADGVSTTPITAQVRDEAGQPVNTGSVNFTTTAGTFVGGGTSITVPLANGVATATLRSANTEQTATVTATVAGTTESASTTVQFTNILITAIRSDPTAIQVGGAETATITAEIITSVGDPVSDGTVVSFALDAASVASGAQITQSATTTNGKATAIVRSGTLAGPVQITVSTGGVTGSFTPLTFTAAPPDHIIMAVQTGKWNTRASTIDPVGITAVVADRFNNPVADGTSVYFTTDVGVITGSSETKAGVADAEIRSDGTLAIANITASTVGEGGAIVTGSITKLFSGPPASVTFLAPPDGSTMRPSTADQPTTTKVIVEVLDAQGNFVVAGTPVEFTCDAGRIGTASTGDGQNYSTAAVDYTAPETIGPVNITAVAGQAPQASLSLNISP
jgi:hypothetical protein